MRTSLDGMPFLEHALTCLISHLYHHGLVDDLHREQRCVRLHKPAMDRALLLKHRHPPRWMGVSSCDLARNDLWQILTEASGTPPSGNTLIQAQTLETKMSSTVPSRVSRSAYLFTACL